MNQNMMDLMMRFLIITSFVGFLLLIYYQLTYWKRRGIIHIPVIPIIGSYYTYSLFSGNSISEFSNNLYSNFPGSKYFAMTSFNSPVIVLKDPELIHEICVKNSDHATDRRSPIDEKMDPILGRNIFSLKGDRWREIRSILKPSFTTSKMKFMYKLVSKVSEDFIQYLINNPENAKLLDTKDAFTRYTNDVIATTAFGISVNSMKNRENEFYQKGKDTVDLSGMKKILKFLAGLIVPNLMRILGFTHLSKDTNEFFLNLIRDTLKSREETKIVRPDMIQLLMEAKKSSQIDITNDDIIAQAFIFFLTGFEPPSIIMSFVCHHLAYDQDIQQKLSDEVDRVFDGEKISYESISKMKYLDMVLKETLRLYPPVAILNRVCAKPIDLPPAFSGAKEITIYPDTELLILIYSIQRDPKYFPNPDVFDPERFSDENKLNIPACAYAPFGFGPRKCIAKKFAIMEMKLVLAQIIQKFVIKPSERSSKNIIIAPKNFNLTAEGGVWLTFEKKNEIKCIE